MEEIKQEDIDQLLEHFSKCLYKAKEADSKVGQEVVWWKAHGYNFHVVYDNWVIG
jgi:hypothetical protein